MKKILVLLLAVISLLYAGCGTQHKVQPLSAPKTRDTTTRREVDGVRGFLILRPIDNIAKGNTKNYPFFYDFFNKNLDFTDNEAEYIEARNFLPEYIDADSIGRGVELQSMSAHPFANFTDDVTKEIAAKSGIQFEYINQYRIANASNIRLRSNSKESMQLLLDMLLSKKVTFPALSDGRKNVDGGQGILTIHPIRNVIKDNNGKMWYVFYDYDGKCIYITDDPVIYEKFSKALPMKMRDGDPENAILVQGISINPFVYFNKQTLEAMSKDKGLQINGGQDAGSDLNVWDVRKLSGYGIVFDTKKVTKALSDNLNVPSTPDNASNQTQPDNKRITIPPFPTSSTPKTNPRTNASPNQDTVKTNGRKSFKPRIHN